MFLSLSPLTFAKIIDNSTKYIALSSLDHLSSSWVVRSLDPTLRSLWIFCCIDGPCTATYILCCSGSSSDPSHHSSGLRWPTCNSFIIYSLARTIFTSNHHFCNSFWWADAIHHRAAPPHRHNFSACHGSCLAYFEWYGALCKLVLV